MRFIEVHRLRSVLAAAFLSCAAAGAASAQLNISRFTIDGGGTHSTGGNFALGGTIGQPDAGHLFGSPFILSGGFWGAGGGTVTAIESGPSGDDLQAGVPLAFHMYPASPNPLAEQTRIAFDLPAPSLVRAALYDVTGRLVRILADEPLPAGKHHREWNRRNQSGQLVPSGVYFLRLDAGEHQSRQKIVVIS
jgi:hypothetical protein